MKKMKEYKLKGLKRLFKNKTFIHVFLFLFVFLGLTFFASVNFLPSSNIKVGEVNPKDIAAPRNAEFVDLEQTEKLRFEAANKIKPVESRDASVYAEQEGEITSLFQQTRKIQSLKKDDKAAKADQLKEKLPLNLPPYIINSLIKLNPDDLNKLELTSKKLLATIMKDSLKQENIQEAKTFAGLYLRGKDFDNISKNCVYEIVSNSIKPNVVVDMDKTQLLQQQEMDKIPAVKVNIKKGQIIVNKGEIVTSEQIKLLKGLNLYAPGTNLPGIIGSALLSLLFIGIVIYFCSKYNPKVIFNDKLLLLLSIIIVFIVALSKTLMVFSSLLAPVAAASILIAILIDWHLALLITILLGLQLGISADNMLLTIVALTSGIAAVLSVSKINRRWDLAIPGAVIIGISALTLIIAGLIQNTPFDYLLKEQILWGSILNGIIAVGFAMVSLPLFENFFNITTHIKLIELSSPNEPLLNKLLIEAPGTYHHSIIVGNLAYGAAQVVGADPLLARVGAYYHDIGKIKRPYFFVENQPKNDNPHDRISPTLSTLIITSHVKDGVELAQKQHLPEVLIDFIREHHGTSLVAYFYHEAMAQASEEEKNELSEEDFRYPGPKPQSKETAVVMLADIAEASVKTLDTVNQVKINNMVKQVIKAALENGQLDECQLSFKNLKDISASFVRTLSGIYHHRIEYPDKLGQTKKEVKNNNKNGKTNSSN
ncbi:MAG: HDIG domain-containing metalloprotein [Armatimonadota bacterium]